MQRQITFYLMILCFCLYSSPAFGHEFILKPDADLTVASNTITAGQVQAAHIFMQSEEAEPISDISLQLSAPLNQTVRLTAIPGHPWLTYSFLNTTAESFILAGWRKPQIWSQTTTGILPGDRATLSSQGKTVISVGKYEKFAKTCYNIRANSSVFTTPLGQRLEIVPDSDLALLGTSASPLLTCKVLLDGKQIALPIRATYDGYSTEEDTYYLTVSPNPAGFITIPITQKGLWLLQTEIVLQKPEEGIDTHNLRATFVFQVE